MSIPILSPAIWWTGAGLGLALAASGALNLYQHQARKADQAACEAARLQIIADIATGTAAAEKEHADQIAAIAVQSSTDEAERIQALDDATKRIQSAASRYAGASKAPLPADCRASADRVRAVNDARGVQ